MDPDPERPGAAEMQAPGGGPTSKGQDPILSAEVKMADPDGQQRDKAPRSVPPLLYQGAHESIGLHM